MENLLLQVEVPKMYNVRLAPLTSTFIEPHGKLLQKAEVDVGGDANNFLDVILHVKLLYSVNGESREDEFQI
ncbi:unnamed protein product [Phytomonas sp. EM1]|nr:unnamed protein product [Phytomonas sp. EM1]|eukprot:CCW59855.1 unnamed protein product [Phytomonas sp. isolate EM1]